MIIKHAIKGPEWSKHPRGGGAGLDGFCAGQRDGLVPIDFFDEKEQPEPTLAGVTIRRYV